MLHKVVNEAGFHSWWVKFGPAVIFVQLRSVVLLPNRRDVTECIHRGRARCHLKENLTRTEVTFLFPVLILWDQGISFTVISVRFPLPSPYNSSLLCPSWARHQLALPMSTCQKCLLEQPDMHRDTSLHQPLPPGSLPLSLSSWSDTFS